MGLISWAMSVIKEEIAETKANALDFPLLNIAREVGYLVSNGETPSPIFVNFSETSLKVTQISRILERNGIPVIKSSIAGDHLIVDVSNSDRDRAITVLAHNGLSITLESPAPVAVFEGLHAMGLVSTEVVREVKSRRGEYPVDSHGGGVKLAKQLREQGLNARVKGTMFTGFKVETW